LKLQSRTPSLLQGSASLAARRVDCGIRFEPTGNEKRILRDEHIKCREHEGLHGRVDLVTLGKSYWPFSIPTVFFIHPLDT
jgi:hypothetical protein